MRYAERAMVKAAYNSIITGMSTENPRAPPMADFATQTARARREAGQGVSKGRVGSTPTLHLHYSQFYLFFNY